MLKKTIFPVILIFGSLLSCASYFAYQRAETAYIRGDYSQAVFELTASLKRDPEQHKAITLLQEAFPLAVEASLECARNSRESNAAFKWSAVADCFLLLHRINDAVKALPPLYDKKAKKNIDFSFTYYHAELKEASTEAAEEQYLAGLAAAADSSSESQKKAHHYFLRTLDYVPGYKDAEQRASSSRDAATARISVLPTADRSHIYMPLDTAALIYNTLLTHLSQGARDKTYTKIIDRGNLDEILSEQKLAVSDLIDDSTALRVGGLMGANRIIISEILQINYTPPEIDVSTEERSAEVPVEDPPQTLEEGQEIPTRIVNGVFIRFEKTTKLSLNVTFKLINLETAELVTGDVISETLEDSTIWGDYEGDEEALTKNDQKILSTPEQDVKSLAELLTETARQVGLKIAAHILSFLD